MKWQIADDYLEEFVAKVHRTMTPRTNKKFVNNPTQNTTPTTTPDQQSPLRLRYPPSTTTEGTPIRPLQISSSNEYMLTSPTTPIHNSVQQPSAPPSTAETAATPERSITNRQFMPMSSPAPFYRYSSITTPASAAHDSRSSPPSSGAIDLAETLVEFSSPVKLREPFARQISLSSDRDDSPSRSSGGPSRLNGIKSSLGDLQGVDLLRGFEKISSWREGSTPVKEQQQQEHVSENGFGKELKRLTPMKEGGHERVNGNGVGVTVDGCIDKKVASPEEEMDSQMMDVKMESEVRART